MSAVPNVPENTPGRHVDLSANGIVLPSIKLTDQPIENQRPLKVIVIGAGYSGVYLAIRIPERLRNVDLVVYEKNDGVGGTWWENRYLGCACDIPSHSYQYSFDPNKNWSNLYAPAKEIQEYIEGVAKKYSADRFIKLSHKVQETRWDDKTAKWTVTVKNLVTGEVTHDQSDIVIVARGGLNEPKWPTIDGLDTFKGELMHSARWNKSYNWENKRVGVIGSGSSSIQIVPSLQRIAGTHINTFVRSKTWISPPFGQQLWDSYGFTTTVIPDELRKRFHDDPEYYHKFRMSVEEDINGVHAITMRGTPLNLGGKEMFYQHMKQRLASRPDIFEFLAPSFSPGCRRLTPGPGYLEALTQPNVTFTTSPITKISESAVHTADGTAHKIDALVCATGFHFDSAPPFPVLGSRGLSLETKWQDRPTAYLSAAVAGFPNMFLMLGPNSAIGSGSLTKMIETIGDYIIRCVRKIQKEDIAAMGAKQARQDDFIEYCDEYFKSTVFTEQCNSWYKNNKTNKVIGLWPGSSLHSIEAMRSVRWEDYEYVYLHEMDEEGVAAAMEGVDGKRGPKEKNRLRWFGNGWCINQLQERDLGWYLYPEFADHPVAPLPEEKAEYAIRPFSY